jgi:hypothetical protein
MSNTRLFSTTCDLGDEWHRDCAVDTKRRSLQPFTTVSVGHLPQCLFGELEKVAVVRSHRKNWLSMQRVVVLAIRHFRPRYRMG